MPKGGLGVALTTAMAETLSIARKKSASLRSSFKLTRRRTMLNIPAFPTKHKKKTPQKKLKTENFKTKKLKTKKFKIKNSKN